jgi:formylglycine-generating enzyme required for sulfatase activity
VLPTTCITWLQAEQACALAGKRMLSNQEWQRTAAGTPDPGSADDGATTCATSSPTQVLTGSRSACRSSWGAFDMIGNAWEMVADWGDVAEACTDWTTSTGLPGDDVSCVGGPGGAGFRSIPGVWLRGGNFAQGARSGALAVLGGGDPSYRVSDGGFRCGR